ncbi:MAG: hypothetical protein ACI4OD_08390 [Selenomonas sp.]
MKIKEAWRETYEHLEAYAKENDIPESRFEQTVQTCLLLGMKEDAIKEKLKKYIPKA